MPGNPYAAIPSLHAGYAFLVFLTVASLVLRCGGRFRWPLAALCFAYPLAQSLAVVYTGNHYVVDIVIGDLFALGRVRRHEPRRGPARATPLGRRELRREPDVADGGERRRRGRPRSGARAAPRRSARRR